MDGGFDLKLITLFDSIGSVVELVEKEHLEYVVPFRLMVTVFAIY